MNSFSRQLGWAGVFIAASCIGALASSKWTSAPSGHITNIGTQRAVANRDQSSICRIEAGDDDEGGEMGGDEQEEGQEREAIGEALGKAKISMSKALEIALHEVKDAKPYSAELVMDGKKAIYDIGMVAGQRFVEVRIDAVSGKVLSVDRDDDDDDDDSRSTQAGSEFEGKELRVQSFLLRTVELV